MNFASDKMVSPEPRPVHGIFATTHWSVVLAARDKDSIDASEAMQQLCRTYWAPLYAFIRRDGHGATEAEDLTQEFFARLLAKDYLAHLRHRQGRFRSFLLTFLKHFLQEERRRARAQKRGGGQVILSLDKKPHEVGFLREPVDDLTPDQVFERRWVQALLHRAWQRLSEEYAARGQTEFFERLQNLQPRAPDSESYADLGNSFGLTEAAVKSAVQRLRRRHREIIREEIGQTVASPTEIDEELRHLQAVVASG